MPGITRPPRRVVFILVVALVGCLAGCAVGSSRPAAVRIESPAIAPIEGASHYRVDPANSELHILVYRGGPLARLGHNHVMSSHDVAGDLWLAEVVERSSLRLSLPVETLIVDDANARAREGEEFEAEVPEDAKQGTRKNMLSAAVLDSAQYKSVELRSLALTGTREAPRLTLAVTIKDQTREIPALATVVYESNRLAATGEFTLRQTDFGIQPFSVGLGALQVADEIKVKFKVIAVKE